MISRFWNDLPVCVIGGTGFLGSHLLEALVQRGARVRDLSLTAGRVQHHGVEYLTGDVRDSQAVRTAVAGARIVFALAGPVGVGLSRDSLEPHSRCVREVIDAIPAGVRLVCTSSIVAVGASRTGQVFNESSPFNLANLKVGYVQAKRRAGV
jgi:nucleoside-diphosphate-sugar epimerase